MSESLVINTGPLITLARIDALDIVGDMPYEFVCPREVRDELDEGVQVGHSQVSPSWLKVLPLKKVCVVHHQRMTNAGPLDILGTIGHGHDYEDLIGHTTEFEVEDMKVGVSNLERLIEIKHEVLREKDKLSTYQT